MDDNAKKIRKRSKDLLELIVKYESDIETGRIGYFHVHDVGARAGQLIHAVTGPKSSYAEQLRIAQKGKYATLQFQAITGVVKAFHQDLLAGNLVNIRHEVEAVVVSEILAQARRLFRTKGIHPAAVILVACAGVEEFLRNWCAEKGIAVPENRRSISVFAAELRKADLINLPTERRILSWADYRNDAAHGSKWDAVTSEIAVRVTKEIDDFVLENSTVLG